MATLETQYQNYLAENPDSSFTFDEWSKWFGNNLKESFEKLDAGKFCKNCEHLISSIGVGQGLRCGNPDKGDPKERIPHSHHTCDLFEYKK